jgi:chemotaxis methyl-accepting protein methylase/pimeloyl-ACP methyl ester carboxylesterase
MGKTAVVNAFLVALVAASPLQAGRFLRGDESGIAVRPTNRNYYISTLLGESEHYAPTFYDDHLITLGEKAVGHFTRVDGLPADFYWYVTDPQDVAFARKAFEERKDVLDAASPRILPAFAAYAACVPVYEKAGLYGKVLAAIKNIAAVAPQRVIGDDHLSKDVDGALFQYLKSNAVSDLSQLRGRPELINMVVNKFYVLSTTYFFRDSPHVKAFLGLLGPIKERLAREKRPFKAKVFACSTGEEVVTYAIELLEAGVRDFTILASDINEPGLRHAEEFRYSHAMVERLPLPTQEKLKKYFRLDKVLGVWSPIDPELFRSRIKYLHQDLLKDLPADLDPRFAPPYDMVSIMNVLFYLEDAAVQARKDAWLRMLAPDGVLILHDFYYSVAAGTLGREWAFKNFLSFNDWVNVRADPRVTVAQKVEFYRKAYEERRTESSFLQLFMAYMHAGEQEKGARLCEERLRERPYSPAALKVLWDLQFSARPADAARTMDALLRSQPHTSDVLDKLAQSVEGDRREAEFLAALRKAQSAFLAGYKSRPRRVEELLDFKDPVSRKFPHLKTLLKIHDLGVLQNHYLGQKDFVEADRTGEAGLRLAAENLAAFTGYPALAGYVDQLVNDRLEHLSDDNPPAAALAAAEDAERRFSVLAMPGSFSGEALAAHIALYKAVSLSKLARPEEALPPVTQAVERFEKALVLLDELPLSRRPFFYGDAGRAYQLRGELLEESGQKDAALKDEARALELFEIGLSYNPLYGKRMHEWRSRLLRRREERSRSGSVPLTGDVLRFSDAYGPYSFTADVFRYDPGDGASIEATLLTPSEEAPRRPGLVFVHMWARDRRTWWGLPEFMASHGYPSVSMDLRGHGGSRFPGDPGLRVTIQDGPEKQARYGEFVRDVLPAIDRLAVQPGVDKGRIVMVGASLGAPVAVVAAARRADKMAAFITLSPSLNYFGVDCREALASLGQVPLLVVAEKTEKTFRFNKEFFTVAAGGYKTYLEMDGVGHGTDAFYRDVGLPTLLLSWLEHLKTGEASFQKIRKNRLLSFPRK